MNNIQAKSITAAVIKLIIFPLRTSDLLISRENRDELWLLVDEYLVLLVLLSWVRRGVSCSGACDSPEEMRVRRASTVEARAGDLDTNLIRSKYTRRTREKHSNTLRVRNVSRRYWSAVSLRSLLGPFVSSKIPDSVWKIVTPVCSSWIRSFRIQTIVSGVKTTYTFMSTQSRWNIFRWHNLWHDYNQ